MWIFTLIYVTPKGDHLLSQRYSELHLNTLSKSLRWLSKKCRWQDSNSQPQRPLPGLISSLILQTVRFYARLYYHAQTQAHNLLRQKVITYWVSAIVNYILTIYDVMSKGDHLLSQRYSELYLNTLSKSLRWLSKKCRRRDLNSQPQRPLSDLISSLMLQTARFYARLYYHVQTQAHNLLR